MTNPNDPVEAFHVCTSSSNCQGHFSLTKREYFAAMAINVVNWHGVALETSAKEALKIADYLIAELNK